MNLRRSLLVCSLLLLVFFPGVLPAVDTDWPHFRGPHHNGVFAGSAFDPGGFGLAVDWKQELGSGYSGISIVGERAVTLSTDGEVDFVVAFEAGEATELWRYELGSMYVGHGGSHDGPISTPAIHDGVVYALGPRGRLAALRFDSGEMIWQKDLSREFPEPTWGYATTPLVVGESLIVLTGGDDGNAVTAYRRSDGEKLWSAGSGSVDYQSPVLVELLGRTQLVVATNQELLGVDPAAGQVLWSHSYAEAQTDGYAQPVVFAGNRILVNGWEEALAFELARDADGYRVEEAWRSTAFRRSYALPVYAKDHLFGFNGRFLTCVDPDTGAAIWRSRPPGGRGLILVDGHLVIHSFEGDLVIVAASPEGYEETARIPLFERQWYTAPSFAGGYLYLRDQGHFARVRITERPTPGLVTERSDEELVLPSGRFGSFLEELRSAADKKERIDAFIAKETFPIVEENRVHFVYRGEAEDVAVIGNMLEPEEELVLTRFPGTELFFGTLELDPEGQWEYRLSIFGDTQPDPLNPLAIGSLSGPSSELRMPRWPVPDHLGEPPGPRGRIDRFTFSSEPTEREIQVYLPAGYDESAERYPLILYHNGNSHLEHARLDWSLDNLMGKDVAPAIVALLPRLGQDFGGATSDAYVEMLTEELIPHLDERYRTVAEPASRTVMGVGSGAYISTYAAFKAPGVFGNLASQSLYTNPATKQALLDAIAGRKQELEIYIEWSRHDYLFEDTGIDAATDSRELAELLEGRGYEVRRNQVTGAAGWGSWRAQLDTILEQFYPFEE